MEVDMCGSGGGQVQDRQTTLATVKIRAKTGIRLRSARHSRSGPGQAALVEPNDPVAPQANTGRPPASIIKGLSRHLFATIPLADGFEIHLKLEGLTPGGSIKDKPAKLMLDMAIAKGQVSANSIIMESTSGNLGIALARHCAARGLRFCAVIDPHASPSSVDAMRAAGADILLVEERDANGGYLGTRIKTITALCAQDKRIYWTNQYANPANPLAHETTTAVEIADSFEHIDTLYIGAGTCGTLTGVGRFMKRYRSGTKIVAIDSEGSVTFGGPAGKRYIPGLGTSRRPENCDPSVIDDLQMVSEADAVAACRWLARRHGLLVGGSTGSVIAGALLHHRRNQNGRPMICVGISPDSGEKYLPTVFNDAWVEERFGRAPILKGAAQELVISPQQPNQEQR